MLNGIDPIVIFQFSKLAPTAGVQLAKIPIISSIPTLIEAPPIPIYLNEQITGLYIESENKNIEIETEIQTNSLGTDPDVNQKGLSETTTINLIGSKNSLGLNLLLTMAGLILDKATSKEYAITYVHGSITIFRGLLHSFSVDQDSNTEKLSVKIELTRGQKTPQKAPGPPVVGKATGTVPL